MKELWRDVLGWEGYYQISNFGRVKSVERWVLNRKVPNRIKSKILKPTPNELGYLTVRLCRNGRPKTHKVHRMVALAFIPNPENLPEVNHKDFNPKNNHHSNLEWTTHLGNLQHAAAAGKVHPGELHGMSKLRNKDIPTIRKRLARGDSQISIAKDYGVNQAQISRIKSGGAWTRV